MTVDKPAPDLEAEREIDLRSWLDALRTRWWIAVAGLVVGALIGGVYSLSGGSTYNASVLIAPGQAFSQTGSPVQTYLTSASAINTIATSNTTLAEASAKSGVPLGQLRGHVSSSAVDLTTGSPTSSQTNRNAVLVQITVQLPKRKKAEDAANAIATIVQQTTISPYVRSSIHVIESQIANFTRRLATEKSRVDATNAALTSPNLSLVEKLILSNAADTALANYNETQQAILTAQQQLYLAKQVQQTQILQQARGAKTTARSRRNSVVVGALIGLIIGAIVAIVVGLRARRTTVAA
jgi:capsular polysaccharide biosynthesis protein